MRYVQPPDWSLGDTVALLAEAEAVFERRFAGDDIGATTEALERLMILRVMRKFGASTTHCAKALGLSRMGFLLKRARLFDRPAAEASDQGYVYVLRDERGACKIGKTKRLRNRMMDLQTPSSVPLQFIGAVPTPQPSKLERHYHRMFARRRLHGEWFDLQEQDICLILGEVGSEARQQAEASVRASLARKPKRRNVS